MLVEGARLRGITRIEGCSINTVTKLLVDAGNACAAYTMARQSGDVAFGRIANGIWSAERRD